VAKQQIFAETVKNEMRHLTKNRTTDFVLNPTQSKLRIIVTVCSWVHSSEAESCHSTGPHRSTKQNQNYPAGTCIWKRWPRIQASSPTAQDQLLLPYP